MITTVKVLSLGELIFNRRGSFSLRLLEAIFGIALSLFFRRIELVNIEKVPDREALIFVMNHPNGLIDPALVFVALPRKISFLAKSTLFKMPVISYLLRTVEALPLYRQKDAGEDVSKNQETFRVCKDLLRKGGAIALFPEGISHNETKLQPLKTGAARIALGAVSVGENPLELKILPVGLFYTNKTTFRSDAMLFFGEPFRVLPVELDEHGQPPREDVRNLTEKIKDALLEVTFNAENEAELQTAAVAERLFSSVYETDDPEKNLADKFNFLRAYVADRKIENIDPKEYREKLEKRLAAYERKLERVGIEPETLALPQYSVWKSMRYFLRQSWFLAVLSPLAVFGTILHFPAYQISKILAFLYARHESRDIASTIKVLSGMVLMPLTWLALAVILYFYFGWVVALISVPLSFLCGYIALRTLEEIEELQNWIKAAWLFINRRKLFIKLLTERRRLHRKLEKGEREKGKKGKRGKGEKGKF